MDILIATTNVHKVREIKQFLKSIKGLDFYSLCDFPDYEPPEEKGDSFVANATLKAQHAAQKLKKWTIADDSGLVVDALDGAPGIFSARYAGPSATDKENRQKLIKEMDHLEGMSRSACFVCSVVLASPQGFVKTVTGTCEGSITRQERGGSGFGYDALFMKHDYNQTFAELPEVLKNKISHRAKALAKLVPSLQVLGEIGKLD